MLFPVLVKALVNRLVSPFLDAEAVLEVILPFAVVGGPVVVPVLTPTVGLVLLPLSFILITIHVRKLALPLSSVVHPLSFVLGSVRPHLRSHSVPEPSLPLARVRGP